ncbi:MAG TPA: peptidogalycan biosysnthesis protein, partial [Polyangia bacterium]|nr:peptidogalycan biosysnthesis protein [Polyangia bacterium]
MGDDDPFLEHGFLAALEESGSVGPRAGIVPRLVLVREGGQLVGAVPLYLKSNSYGEFIFDWAWANGAQRAGIRYYPKLVAAIPFTPATGRRLLVAPGANVSDVRARLLAGTRAVADDERVSSVHFLFCTEDEADWLAQQDFARRLSMQFHWHNRAPAPYASYDDFLGEMKSRHRKQLRHERAVATSHGLTLRTLTGPELDADGWRALRAFYNANADKHGAHHYLTPKFFDQIQARY